MFGVATTQAPSPFYSNVRFNEDARHEVRPSFTKGQFDCSREPLDMSHDNSEEFDDE